MKKAIPFYRVKELKEALNDLPDETPVRCHVVAGDSPSWIMWGSLVILDSGIAIIKLEHDDIKALPPITHE